ncbi:hypothetical protein GFD17_01330 [Bifidobacterium sp. SMB2]|uniref:Uncharacterized protein n=1 Tax=Bifidobacterium saimiriisciurei TaxID=2661627 RepID=A0ABX0C8C9_9BIFI|nr:MULTISPECIES: hypothetical protein [Bifidobacterium]NEG95418.1 hypothetical protein [Bifidobacterium sp. SMB2]NEH11398.1 hypothetical protein [Bifidobacterium saimiriisciurei]
MPSEQDVIMTTCAALEHLKSRTMIPIAGPCNVYRLDSDLYVTEDDWLNVFHGMPRWASDAFVLWTNGHAPNEIAATVNESGYQALHQAASASITEADAECFFTAIE